MGLAVQNSQTAANSAALGLPRCLLRPAGRVKATSAARAPPGQGLLGSWGKGKPTATPPGAAGTNTQGGAAVAPHNRHHHKRDHHSNLTVNVLVAHLEEGLEVVHLFTGKRF